MKILHIAPYNTAGVPITFVNADRRLGHHSRLLTLQRNLQGYEEDLCLDLPLLQPEITATFKRLLYPRRALRQSTDVARPATIPPRWRPANLLSQALIKLRDALLRPAVNFAIKQYQLDAFDVYQLDGGQGFLKYDDIIPAWHARGKKVVCCYLGSDLRRRGVMPGIDGISDCNVTLEWDHLDLHPKIHHVNFPFDASAFAVRTGEPGAKLRIGHSPSDRAAKGSDIIIAAVKRLAAKLPADLVLIEDMTHSEALAIKATCDIGVDQVGQLGYGISALEWLAMGVPVATCIADNMKKQVTDHPFVEINEGDIGSQLEKLVTDKALRQRLGAQGRQWLERNHDAVNVTRQLHELAGISAP